MTLPGGRGSVNAMDKDVPARFWEKLSAGVRTGGPEETEGLAAELAGYLPQEAVLALSGPLGAGKTTFVRGLARAWGITGALTSPTFNLYAIYRGERMLVHFDAYRLESAAEAEALLIEELLERPYCLAVEWPEHVAGWLPPGAMGIELTPGEGDERVLRTHRT